MPHPYRPSPAVLLCLAIAFLTSPATASEPQNAEPLAFKAEGKAFRFDTGVLRGLLRSEGKPLGLTGVIDMASGASIDRSVGLFSHYRLLDTHTRYGTAGWDWPSQAELQSDGSVIARWSADADHPFTMTATYRWSKPNILDVTTTITPQRDLPNFEVFLASYFAGFPESLVYAQASPTQASFVPARQSSGDWQMFPRDPQVIALITDGRWNRPPHPVAWKILPRLAAPLAIRRDPKTGLTALVMAPPTDCFAISTPYGEEDHRSLYLSLFGHNLKTAHPATARARLIIGKNISDQEAISLFESYMHESPSSRPSRPYRESEK